jgi:hypothetical protein
MVRLDPISHFERKPVDEAMNPGIIQAMITEHLLPNRRTLRHSMIAAAIILLQSGCSLVGIRSTAEPDYAVLQKDESFEVREYDRLVVVETVVDASFDDAGGIAFRRLFGYISGDNQSAAEIAMTAPVIALDESSPGGEEIAMTAPVTGQQTAFGWRFAFVLPSDYTHATAPLPNNPDVRLEQLPARKVAVLRYSGSWSESGYTRNVQFLQQWMNRNQLAAGSAPRVAGYDPPWTLPFLRRNEIMIDIRS